MKLGYVVATSDVKSARLPSAQGDLAENLRLLAGIGYEGVELSVWRPADLDAARLEREVAASGLAVCCVHTAAIGFEDRLWLCHEDEEVRRAAMKRLKEAADLAGRFGVDVAVGSFRGKLLEGEGRERSLGWMRDAFREGADYAAARGLRVLIEPYNRFVTNFANSAEESAAFVRGMRHEGLGLLLDTFHVNIEDPSFGGAIYGARDCLFHMHLTDNNRMYPGAGHIPFAEVIGALRAIGYGGYLSIQIAQKPDFRTAAARSHGHIRSLL